MPWLIGLLVLGGLLWWKQSQAAPAAAPALPASPGVPPSGLPPAATGQSPVPQPFVGSGPMPDVSVGPMAAGVNSGIVNARVGQWVVISLPAQPGTPSQWQINVGSPGSYAAQSIELYGTMTPGLSWSQPTAPTYDSSSTSWGFVALAPGQTSVMFSPTYNGQLTGGPPLQYTIVVQ